MVLRPFVQQFGHNLILILVKNVIFLVTENGILSEAVQNLAALTRHSPSLSNLK